MEDGREGRQGLVDYRFTFEEGHVVARPVWVWDTVDEAGIAIYQLVQSAVDVMICTVVLSFKETCEMETNNASRPR